MDTMQLAREMFDEYEIPKISKLKVYYRDNSYYNDPYVLGL